MVLRKLAKTEKTEFAEDTDGYLSRAYGIRSVWKIGLSVHACTCSLPLPVKFDQIVLLKH